MHLVLSLTCLALALIALPNKTAAQDQELVHRAQSSLQRGVDWLLQQQATDGGWHSETYGQMRGGIGNTALTVYALAHLPQPLRDEVRPQFRRSIKFLLTNLDDRGFPRTADNSVDYPTYATALSLIALERMETKDWSNERKRMREFLTKAQFPTVDSNVDSGGWSSAGRNLGGGTPSEHANISATSLALEALATTGGLDKSTKHNALLFLARCQNLKQPPADGGFFFTPLADDPLNKAGLSPHNAQHLAASSYGTATADGLIALKTCGVANDDPRVKAATAWLTKHTSLDHVPGFPTDKTEANLPSDAMKFYFYFSIARVVRQLPDTAVSKQLPQVAEAIIRSQQPTGAWANSSTAMREDDPLIATPLALVTLSTYLEAASKP